MSNTEAGNRVIAEFMGLETVDYICERCGHDVRDTPKCSDRYPRTHALGGLPRVLNYHTSWDWLHTAFEKFRSLKISLADEGFNDHYSRHLETIGVAIIHYPIEKAFERLVNGITWYNTNSKPGEAGIV